LVETGKAAFKYLTPLLGNDKAAPLNGSADATASVVYKYRRKDFAYRYVSLIIGEQPTFHTDPKARDKDIEMLKRRLWKAAK
jgi:hypothetical protein